MGSQGRRAAAALDSHAARLRQLVEGAVQRAPAESLLLSGGLDTSVLAPIAAAHGCSTAVTVLVGAKAPDRAPAKRIARELGWEHCIVDTTLDELLDGLDTVVRALETFDPMEVRNSLVIARALEECRSRGLGTAMVGDGADELFGGYDYMIRMPEGEFEAYSRRLARTMRFSAGSLGKAIGVRVSSPYLDPDIIAFAAGLPRTSKVGVHDGHTLGKWILREAFPEAVSRWRRKDPIEVGSGSARLPEWFARRTAVDEFGFEQKRLRQQDRVEIRDPEHLAYFQAFRRAFPSRLSEARFTSGCCVHCGFRLARRQATFCRTCGAYPAQS
jgi:asparagine synthase (glutamine-hydrolysing)